MSNQTQTDVTAQCDWTTGSGTKRDPFGKCPATAVWRQESKRIGGFWHLCDEHKRLLLGSYNETWRAKEEPEWKPIQRKTTP